MQFSLALGLQYSAEVSVFYLLFRTLTVVDFVHNNYAFIKCNFVVVETFSSTPTLLHFAAQYNLLRLSIALLECPGGRNALNTANEDGYTPSDLAHSYGHENLAAVLVSLSVYLCMFMLFYSMFKVFHYKDI